MQDTTSGDTRKYEELRLLYTVTISDIASFKQQQWHITNYALLLLAAVVAIQRFLSDITQAKYWVLFLAAFGVVIAGWYLLGYFPHQSSCGVNA